jgi:hypothetical protein
MILSAGMLCLQVKGRASPNPILHETLAYVVGRQVVRARLRRRPWLSGAADGFPLSARDRMRRRGMAPWRGSRRVGRSVSTLAPVDPPREAGIAWSRWFAVRQLWRRKTRRCCRAWSILRTTSSNEKGDHGEARTGVVAPYKVCFP